ncbi:hypothetical protein ACFXKS_06985 [Streptomyces scopuliridis]|uniref:hypothetical protein n=1 Tax=Streptomyces scopuliridis TaxID=452529 RepID=UPI0036BA065E
MHDEGSRIEDRVGRVLTRRVQPAVHTASLPVTVAPRPFQILTDRFTRSAV